MRQADTIMAFVRDNSETKIRYEIRVNVALKGLSSLPPVN